MSFIFPAAYAAETVRVGFFAFDGYHMQGEDGVRSGYGYELLQRMAGYAGWKYDYVGYDKSWSDMQDMLESGEIDLVTSAQKTPERLERFDFSQRSIGTSAAILTVQAGNNTYLAGDYASWNGMRVGMLEGNSRNDSFAAFAAENGFTYESVFFSSIEAMKTALREGTALDAILTSNLRKVEDEWVLAQFASSPFYVMVRKGNTALLRKIDAALERLEACEPEYVSELMSSYYGVSVSEVLALDAEERAFVQAMRGTTFTAVISPERKPYSYLNEGKLDGVLYTAAMEIVRRSGLNVEFLDVRSDEELSRRIQSGGVDIRFDVPANYPWAEKDGYWQTIPYIDVPIARLYREDVTEYRTIAQVRNSNISTAYNESLNALGVKAVEYDSIGEVIDAVMEKKQDMGLLPIASANLAVWNDVTNRLVAEECYGYSTSFAVGVHMDQDPLLFSILNRAAASLGQQYINKLNLQYELRTSKPFTLIGYFYDYPIHVILFVAVILFILGLLYWLGQAMKRKKQAVAQMEEQQRQSELLKNALATAENAAAAKSQFLSRVSHEMRTPLNAIIGFLSLSRGAEPEQRETYLDNSEIAAKQLVSVINDVLDMSSIESGKMKISNAPFDFKQLIHSITNLYVVQCLDKGIKYETRLLTPTEEWLIGDQLRVNQVLLNLLGNAVKFTSQGYVHLSVTQTQTQNERVFMRFEVSDTGCGMSEETLSRLFQPFEQGDATTAQKYGGSGLGLSIVKSLVNMMGGAIKVESQPNKGSTFTVDLPFGRGEASGGLQTIDSASSLRVLAVDDDPVEQAYVSAVLKRIGVQFRCVSDCEQALKALDGANSEEKPYNVCLVDWKMPKADGIETTRRIREKYGKDVIVIVVSAYDHAQADESARAAGANLFVSKPLFQSSLFDLFMTLTGGRVTKRKTDKNEYSFDGQRVLLVEDNNMNRLLAKSILKKMNVACDEAEDGQIGYDMFMASAPGAYGAILMDMQMPRMDGIAATRLIRAADRPDAKAIHIIALTANAFNEDVAKVFSAGMNAHVAKPIDVGELAKALDKAFRAGKEDAAQRP